MANHIAPEGQLYVCGACGKRSKDLYGTEHPIDGGYDESCMLNAVLVYEQCDIATGGGYKAVMPREPKIYKVGEPL